MQTKYLLEVPFCCENSIHHCRAHGWHHCRGWQKVNRLRQAIDESQNSVLPDEETGKPLTSSKISCDDCDGIARY